MMSIIYIIILPILDHFCLIKEFFFENCQIGFLIDFKFATLTDKKKQMKIT